MVIALSFWRLPVQLNDRLLQLENEYYSAIRLKQTLRDGEALTDGLEERGIEYLEMRVFDLDPFERIGVSLEQLRFIQSFALYCLFQSPDMISAKEKKYLDANNQLVAALGRNGELKLYKPNQTRVSVESWGLEILNNLRTVAALLDSSVKDGRYLLAVESQLGKIRNPRRLPSAIILREMQESNTSYRQYGLQKARKGIEGEAA